MGEVKNQAKPCSTVALRYRFVSKESDNGEFELQFLPHELIKLEVELPKDQTPEPEVEVVYEDDVEYLRSLDPKEWKKQDHYKVLGIKNLRYKASDDVIKTAYRKMVLKHHPDKRKAQGEEIRQDDDYFTCITMAYETLGNSLKRRSYDSVDPDFDDALPSASELKKDFYKVFSKYFEMNSRWSEKRKVPKLGGVNSSRSEVEHFYSFWYDFKSWREYSYEDEEDKDKCTDRDERRYVDKMNKAERLRKKKEEMSRIRQLVDMAYNADPRIAKFKQEDKEKKLAAKKAKQTAAQAKRDEEERVLREAQLAKEKAEAAERAKIEAKRQEREVQKKALKKERKLLRDVCKTNNYFVNKEEDNLRHMTALERICEGLSALELEELNKNIKNNGKTAFLKAMKESEEKAEAEKKASLQTYQQKLTDQVKNNVVVKINPEWTYDNLQLLIKAVNLFPAGTNQRWDVVANFINQHGQFKENSTKFNAKLVLAKAKDLQSTDFSKNNLKEAANKVAFDNFIKEKKVAESVKNAEISTKDALVENGTKTAPIVTNGEVKESKESTPWTTTEQQLLEQALKTYPSNTAERWDRISECIPNRSKKDCMKRYKELVETIKAKKAAQANLAAKITFSSIHEEKCSFTRDYNLIKAELKNINDYDKTCIEPALQGISQIVLAEWGNNTACQVILVTDGNTGVGPGSLRDSINTLHQRTATNPFPLPFSFPSKLHVVCIAPQNDPSLVKSKPLYQKLIDLTGSEGSISLPQTLSESCVSTIFQKLADDMYTTFKGTLKCGNLESNIFLLPAPIPYTKVSDFECKTYSVSNSLEVCGFIAIADIGSPMAVSRHLILPSPTIPKEKPTVNPETETESDSSEEDKNPSFCVLFHGALKVENMAALVTVGEDWFGFIYSWADSKKKSNLMLTALMPGSDIVPWLGDLNNLHCAEGVPPDIVMNFPIRSSEKRSYSQNSVVWIRQAGLQSDIQKILRHAKKLPEKTQQFYKELNRLRKAAIQLGFLDLLTGLASIFDQECTQLPGTAHPDCALQLTHAAEALRKIQNRDIKHIIMPMQTNYTSS